MFENVTIYKTSHASASKSRKREKKRRKSNILCKLQKLNLLCHDQPNSCKEPVVKHTADHEMMEVSEMREKQGSSGLTGGKEEEAGGFLLPRTFGEQSRTDPLNEVRTKSRKCPRESPYRRQDRGVAGGLKGVSNHVQFLTHQNIPCESLAQTAEQPERGRKDMDEDQIFLHGLFEVEAADEKADYLEFSENFDFDEKYLDQYCDRGEPSEKDLDEILELFTAEVSYKQDE